MPQRSSGHHLPDIGGTVFAWRMGVVERKYYVEAPLPTTQACWQAFEQELNSPAALLDARFEEDGTRTCVRLPVKDAGDPDRLDDAMRRFRWFLVSRGVVPE